MPKISKEILITVGLIALDVLVVYFHLRYGGTIALFNIDKERSFNAIISSTQFLFIGIFASLHTILLYALKSTWRRITPWALLGAGCIYFAVDDLFEIHERLGVMLNKVFSLGGFWGESFNWLIYFAPFLLIGAYMLYFVARDICKASRMQTLGIGLGLCFFIAALGLEYYEGIILVTGSQPMKLYHTLLLFEEFFELLGASFILTGIFSYVSKQIRKHVHVS